MPELTQLNGPGGGGGGSFANFVTVAKSGGDYTTIAAALAAIPPGTTVDTCTLEHILHMEPGAPVEG